MNAEQLDATRVPAHLQAMFSANPFAATFGLEVVSFGAGRCELRFPFRTEFTQHRGGLQGGIITVYADAAMAIAVMTTLPENMSLVTTDLHMQFVRPITAGPIIARGEIVNRTETLLVTAATVEVPQAGLCARGSATFVLLPNKQAAT